jgi:hypothetical protein
MQKLDGMTDSTHSCPPVPQDTRHALQARAARWNYIGRIKDLHITAMVRELQALLNDLRRLIEVAP